jgi:rod shape determining protein RodA
MSLGALSLNTPAPPTFGEKIWRINWGLVLVLTAIAAIGVLALYSAAGGRFEPWAGRHAMRFGMALALGLVVALIHPKVWLALAWPTAPPCCCWSRSTSSARSAWARNAGW